MSGVLGGPSRSLIWSSSLRGDGVSLILSERDGEWGKLGSRTITGDGGIGMRSGSGEEMMGMGAGEELGVDRVVIVMQQIVTVGRGNAGSFIPVQIACK